VAAGQVYLSDFEIDRQTAVIAGRSSEMDRGAMRTLRAVRASALGNRLTGSFIDKLRVVSVPGERGYGRNVQDRLVVADDPGSAAIEFGRMYRVEGARRVRWEPGQHHMRNGMRSA
jgi:hypothetical protein